MRCLLVITLAALTCLSAPAAAQDARGALSRVGGVERRLELYEAHRGRLERQLDEQSKRIVRLKKQPTGVGRDLQLKAALRDSQQLASRLTKMQGQLRELRSNLLSHYAEAIEHAKDETTRQAWRARRRKLLERSSSRSKAAKLATGTRANALDGVEDLEEKADLLADSEAKVRRQLRRLSQRIGRIERRSKLRRHGRAATDTPFVEDSTRRLGGSRRLAPAKIASGRTDGATQGESGPATPAPPPSGNWSGTSDPKAGPGGGGTSMDAASGAAPLRSSTLQRGLDPATLKALAGSAKGSPAQQLAALKKARERLQKLAKGLAERSAALRKRAGTLKKQPRRK